MLLGKYSSLSKATRLRYATKALNETVGEKGLLPSMLVFGVMPPLGNYSANIHDQGVWFEGLKKGREKAATIAAENDQPSRLVQRTLSAKYALRRESGDGLL